MELAAAYGCSSYVHHCLPEEPNLVHRRSRPLLHGILNQALCPWYQSMIVNSTTQDAIGTLQAIVNAGADINEIYHCNDDWPFRRSEACSSQDVCEGHYAWDIQMRNVHRPYIVEGGELHWLLVDVLDWAWSNGGDILHMVKITENLSSELTSTILGSLPVKFRQSLRNDIVGRNLPRARSDQFVTLVSYMQNHKIRLEVNIDCRRNVASMVSECYVGYDPKTLDRLQTTLRLRAANPLFEIQSLNWNCIGTARVHEASGMSLEKEESSMIASKLATSCHLDFEMMPWRPKDYQLVATCSPNYILRIQRQYPCEEYCPRARPNIRRASRRR